MAKTFDQVKTPLSNLSWTPDVPPAALGPNEYNAPDAKNVETDIRGIRQVLGERAILTSVVGTPIYISGNYRGDDRWWYIIGTQEGKWFRMTADNNGNAEVYNCTPGYALNNNVALSGYYAGMPITEAWNGNILFINDSINPPMYLLGDASEFVFYSNTAPRDVASLTGDGTYVTYTFTNPWTGPGLPFRVGEQITINGIYPSGYNGTFAVYSVTDNDVTVVNSTTTTPDIQPTATITAVYTWNYNPNWTSLAANFMRLFNTPNVGSILIAGDLTANRDDSTEDRLPTTVRWSQAFGLNSGPITWEPTITNVANELEVPVRGPVIDGFPCNGNFFVCSYWDTVIFSPINYQTTTIPILGVRLFNQGRGLLNQNCWANADDTVYGVDARDIWIFDGNNFMGLGNQRVKNWFYSQLNSDYIDRVFLEMNTQKNQVEIYFPDLDSTGWCNKMISYRYDLKVWNPPRDVPNASMACESPIFRQLSNLPTENFDPGSRCTTFSRGVANTAPVQKDQGYTFLGNTAISSKFERTNIQLLKDYSDQLLLHRVLPEFVNLDEFGVPVTGLGNSAGNANVTIGGSNSTGQAPEWINTVTIDFNTNDPWVQANQNAYRLNHIKIECVSSSEPWLCSAINWQFTPTQVAR